MIGLVDKHPDPDQIAACAAGAINGCDRENLLLHMSECGTCRECFFALSPLASRPETYPLAFPNWVANLAMSTALAVGACWLISNSSSPAVRHAPPSALARIASRKSAFQHLTLVSASNRPTAPARWVVVRFFDGKPQPNQIVLRTPHGERLITFAMPFQ